MLEFNIKIEKSRIIVVTLAAYSILEIVINEQKVMYQLLCVTVERGDIGLIVIGRGKRKSIESAAKAYRKCCETNSKAVRRLVRLIFNYRMGVGAEPGARVFQSPPEAYLGLSELLSLERCRDNKRVSRCWSVAAVCSILRFSIRRRRFFGHSLVNSLKGVCPLI